MSLMTRVVSLCIAHDSTQSPSSFFPKSKIQQTDMEQQRQPENKYSQVFASNHIVTFLDLVEKVGKEIALVETNIEAVGKEIQDVTES